MTGRVKFLLGLVAFTIAVRLMPYVLSTYNYKLDPTVLFYPWNFVPLTAVCLYSGAYFADRRISFGMPLLALFASDVGMALITGHWDWGFPPDRWSAYVCYPIIVLMGKGLSRRSWPIRGLDAVARGVIAEVFFFVVTNFAYFLLQSDYSHDVNGLMTCYIKAIPFQEKALISTVFYSLLLFSPLAVPATVEEQVQTTETLQPTALQ